MRKFFQILALCMVFVFVGCESDVSCDDGNACTNDYVVYGECQHSKWDYDFLPDYCNGSKYCYDGDPCTHDTFVNGECRHETTDYTTSPDLCTWYPEACESANNYSWRPEKEVSLNCAWLSQKPDADAYNMFCGRTSLVMATACIDRYTPEYKEIIELSEWMAKNIPSYGRTGAETGTHLYQLEDAAEGYYGLSAQSFGEDTRVVVTLKDMYDDLKQGMPVLVAVWGQETCNLTDVMKNNPGNGHVELLVGMSPTHVMLNDPWSFDIALGRNRKYTIESFLTAWDGGVRLQSKRL